MKKASGIDAAIGNLDADFLQCRDLRHSWRPFWAVQLPRGKGFEEELHCSRCGAARVRLLDGEGFVVASRMKRYPDGYLFKGFGRLTSADNALLRGSAIVDRLGGKRA